MDESGSREVLGVVLGEVLDVKIENIYIYIIYVYKNNKK
jgi:hypothetical protein